MAFIVELFGVVGANMTENRSVLIVTLGLVGKKLRKRGNRVQIIIGLPFVTKHVVFGEVIETAGIDRDVAGAVNLVVDIHEHITRASFVAAGLANITATCGEVTSDPCVVTVTQSLEEAKFYGCGAFTNNAGTVVAYDYVFTRSTTHEVTLNVVFSRSMSGIICNDTFPIYINGTNQNMSY